jgi:hypothetical protein
LLALLAAAAISSASAIDVSARCVAELQGGLPAFSVTASPTGPKLAARFRVPASLSIETAQQENLLFVTAGNQGYVVDSARCTQSKRGPALSRRGLPQAGVYRFGDYLSLVRRCVGVRRFAFRARITTNARGRPVAAELAISSARGKPLAYVRWARSRVAAWASPVCRDEA